MPRASLVLVLLLFGCKEKAAAVPDAPPPAPPPTADARPSMAGSAGKDGGAAPTAPDAGGPATSPPSGKSVGVPACDEYLDKMARCVERLSPESREPLAAAMEDSRKAWQATAATFEGRAALVDACQAALEAAKSAATAMGCSW